MHACYFSGKRGDLVNLSERLVLCLVMLALAPVELRHKRTIRLNALVREAKRGAGKYLEDGKVHHVFFRASSADNRPPEVSGPRQETAGGCSDPGQDKIHSRPHQQAPCALCTAHAVLRPSHSPSPRKTKQVPMETSPAMPDNEPEPLSCSPSYSSGSAHSRVDTPKELSPLGSCALLGTQLGVDGEVNSHAGKVPYHPAGKNSSGLTEGAQAPSILCNDAKSGSLFVVDQDRSSASLSWDMAVCPGGSGSAGVDSMGSPGAPRLSGDSPKKESGNEQAGTNDSRH
jgi:hypothetical protein